MSIIRTDSWQNSAGTATYYRCVACVDFNGTLTAGSMIRASGNVASITDHGVGDYTINFLNALPSANYAVAASGNGAVSTQHCIPFIASGIGGYAAGSSHTTTAISVSFFNAANSGLKQDQVYASVAVFQ